MLGTLQAAVEKPLLAFLRKEGKKGSIETGKEN